MNPLRAEMLQFPNESEAKIEKFRSALRAEMLKFHKESEAKIENFRSALRAERLHRKLSAKSSNFCEILAKISPKSIMKD